MANFVQAITLVVYDTSALTGSFAALNGSGTTQPLKILKIYNASDVGITLSLNGSTNHDFMPAGGTFLLDVQANASKVAGGDGSWLVKKGQIIYGKGSAGTGNLYITGYY